MSKNLLIGLFLLLSQGLIAQNFCNVMVSNSKYHGVHIDGKFDSIEVYTGDYISDNNVGLYIPLMISDSTKSETVIANLLSSKNQLKHDDRIKCDRENLQSRLNNAFSMDKTFKCSIVITEVHALLAENCGVEIYAIPTNDKKSKAKVEAKSSNE
ncbi:hypothetical protein N9N67_06700 [Bacteriovoracaceae bacterium]|nr:hypothetical protein [Bacteriovoracaceae bacterium]